MDLLEESNCDCVAISKTLKQAYIVPLALEGAKLPFYKVAV